MDTSAVPSWMTLLIQVPLVGVFIWYSLEMAKRSAESQRAFMESLEKRDGAFETRNKAVIDAISNLNNAICVQLKEIERGADEHDRYVRENMAKISDLPKGLSDHDAKVDRRFSEAVAAVNGNAAKTARSKVKQ
jgi:hypothetical protein